MTVIEEYSLLPQKSENEMWMVYSFRVILVYLGSFQFESKFCWYEEL